MVLALAPVLATAGCDSRGNGPPDGGSPGDAGQIAPDAGATDGGPILDGGMTDAGPGDAGLGDAGIPDGGTPPDAGQSPLGGGDWLQYRHDLLGTSDNPGGWMRRARRTSLPAGPSPTTGSVRRGASTCSRSRS